MLRLFRALRHTEFRIFFAGQLISITGTWMQSVAQAWLVYRITGSSTMLGLVAFAGLAPVLVFGLFMGVLADHLPRRRLLLIAHTTALLQAALLALLALSGRIETWHIVALAFALGFVHALEMPTRHAFVAEMVPDEDLPNAIALNSSVFNFARFLGPALAGAIVTLWGEGVVFALNAVSFLAVLASLFYIRPRPAPQGTRAPGHMTAGVRHAWTTPVVRHALILLGIVSLAGTSYTVLMPVIAHRLFAGEADTLGLLLGSAGLGALLAALRLAWLGGRQELQRQTLLATFVGAIGMLTLGSAQHWGLSLAAAMAILVLLGFSLTTLVASVNTLLQTNTPAHLRGRTMALFSTLFIGFNSLGNLMSGAIAERLGPGTTVLGFGLVCLVGAAYYRSALAGSDGVWRR